MAATSGGFSIRISAADNASKSIDLINKRLQALQAPVTRMHAGMAKLAKLSGFNAISRGLGSIARSAVDAARGIAGIVPGLSAITGAASIAGLYRLVDGWAQMGTRLLHTSHLLGTSTSRIQGMGNAARLMGSDAEAMTSGLVTLGNNIQDGIAGRAPQFVERMAQMGIAIRDANGNARNSADVFDKIQSVMSRYRDPMIRAQTATELFGGAAASLLPILSAQPGAWRAAQAEAARYGVTSEGAAKKADMMRRAQTSVALALEGMGQAIATKVGPQIEKLLTDFAGWLVKITPDVVKLVEQFTTWLSGDWGPFKEGLNAAWETFKKLNITVDDLILAAKIFAGLWTLSAMAPVFLGITQMGLLLKTALAPLIAAPAALSGLLPLLARFAPWAVAAGIMAPSTTNGGRSSTDPSISSETEQLRAMGLAIPPGAAPTGDRATAEASIFRGLVARGLSAAEAAGATANAMRESTGMLGAINPAGGGVGAHGLFQWRADRARLPDGRLASAGTLDEQLDHFMRDRDRQRNPMANSRANPNNPHAPGTAAHEGWVYSDGFERHGNAAETAARAAEAERVLQRQRALAQPPAAPAAAPARGVDAVTRPPGPQSSLTGNARLEVAFSNAPAGMTARGTTSGDLWGGPPNISMGMPSYASA